MSVLSSLPNNPRLEQLTAAVAGRLYGADEAFDGVAIDSRTLTPGQVFVALRAAHDGHEHVAHAVQQGAVGAVVDHRMPVDVPQIVVADTQAALQRGAGTWRRAFAGPVAGITGSNGKTTVRRMLTSILAHAGSPLAPVLASNGNFNNHLGVPLTLLGLRASHASAVIEMGANHAGEIDFLSHMVRPQVAVITNAGDAHLEGFGSRDGVARAKGEIYAQLAPQAIAVINADDAYAEQWTATAAHCRRLYFALRDGRADVHASALTVAAANSRFQLHMPDGMASVELALPGEHNVRNALAAAASAAALGLPVTQVAAGLANMAPTAGRLQILHGHHGARIVDDSYNANPTSLNAALAWLGRQPGPRWLVLGDMAELGSARDQAHAAAGDQARAERVDRLWATGQAAQQAADRFGPDGAWFADHEQLNSALQQALAESVARPPIVLVKGSRSARMDRVVAGLVESAAGGASC